MEVADSEAHFNAGSLRAEPASIRVLLVDDHFALADSLALAIELEPGMDCVGIAGTASQALELAAGCDPDVVLMDVRLPDGSGLEVAARIKQLRPGISVLMLTGHPDRLLMARAAEAGASGFLRKDARVTDILRTIRLAATGALSLDASALRALVNVTSGDGQRRPDSLLSHLTARESEVLALMVDGLGPKAIALRLGITVSTCRSYVKAILQKLGVHSQLEAVAVAAREGLAPGDVV